MLLRTTSTRIRTALRRPYSTMPRTLDHLNDAISVLTPLSLAETSWDNVGVMVESPRPRQIARGTKRAVYLCIDLTRQVAREALSNPSTVSILTYHPPIFGGLKRLTLANSIQQSLLECVAEGVDVTTIHTAADVAVGGTNDYMATRLVDYATTTVAAQGQVPRGGQEEDVVVRPGQGRGVSALKENSNPPTGHEGCGMGRIVDLSQLVRDGEGAPPLTLSRDQVVEAVKDTLGIEHFQAAWSPTGSDAISTIAICAGSGSSVLKGVEADLYLTGEMGHHDILAANSKGIHVFCCNHTATERPWLKFFAPRLERQLNEAATAARANGKDQDQDQGVVEYQVIVSEADREPLQVV